MKTWALPLLLLTACSSPRTPENVVAVNNAWSSATAWAVLQAQDHRDTEKLHGFLNDTSATIRAAAAMAFASVQDSSARPWLTDALGDASPQVRRGAAWALSFVADTNAVLALSNCTLRETDPATKASMYTSSFRALMRAKPDQDPTELIAALRKSDGYQRVRIADALRRLPKEKLAAVERNYIELVEQEREPAVKMLLIGGLKNFTDTLARKLVGRLLHDADPMVRTAAVRAYPSVAGNDASAELLRATQDSIAAVRTVAVEQLQQFPGTLDGDTLWNLAQRQGDPHTAIPLYGLVMKYGDDGAREVCRSFLKAMAQQDLGPYLAAALVKPLWYDSDTARRIMLRNSSAVVRQAAMDTWLEHFAASLKDSEVTKAMRDQAHAAFMREALTSGDAGLIASACEKIMAEDQAYLKDLLDAKTIASVRAALHPIRDLEALQDLEIAIAKRDGQPAPAHKSPSFNHPIDRAHLAALKQDQQYRITTTQGDIILAIEPNAAPGTCVAFDSLVTAGFYNGKYFHRVVPNFVAQGGCPRGDGYGAMDWTLRTEVGYDGFITGAVGVASAGRDTESCQFFIMLAPAPHLDGRYTRFAHVVSGLEVAQRLVVGDRMIAVQRIP